MGVETIHMHKVELFCSPATHAILLTNNTYGKLVIICPCHGKIFLYRVKSVEMKYW